MLDAVLTLEAFRRAGVSAFAGVPDSLLAEFCACVADRVPAGAHVVAANEGAAVAIAAGHHLATGALALVYMQNSGQGNAINPLLSLADPEVYAIPMLLLVGWRAEPGVADEPQHRKQGKVTFALFEAMGIEAEVLPAGQAEADRVIAESARTALATGAPRALVVRKGTFGRYDPTGAPLALASSLVRERAIEALLDSVPEDSVIVSTTGMISRELYELRRRRSDPAGRDFLTVGSMGHASQIALGIALARPDKRVLCLDGDGAALMHMGALAVIGQQAPARFTHVVLDNAAHDSVGGQPTATSVTDLARVAAACGYVRTDCVDDEAGLRHAVASMRDLTGPCLLRVRVARGARADLGRPTSTPAENKARFMQWLST